MYGLMNKIYIAFERNEIHSVIYHNISIAKSHCWRNTYCIYEYNIKYTSLSIVHRLLPLLQVHYNVCSIIVYSRFIYSILIKEMIMALYWDENCQSSFFHPKWPKNGLITLKLGRKKCYYVTLYLCARVWVLNVRFVCV